MRVRARTTTFLLGLATTMVACGGGDPPTPPVVPGTLAVVVAPTTVAVVAGASGTSGATITRGGSFTGDVALSAAAAPAGVTVSFGTPAIGAGATTSTITIATAATVAPGSYPITISATATGVTTATAVVTLTVTAAPTPTVAVSVAPTSASIVAGTNGAATATIVRGGGFAGDVALTSSGTPTGMVVTFTPSSIGAGATTSAIAVATTSAVTPGNYTITVSAAGTGVTTATATLTVTVTAPVVSGNAVALAFCAADAPIWLAYQDGTGGSWTRVTPNAGTNTYQFNTTDTRIGVASVDTVGTGFELTITYATTAEMNGIGSTFETGACGAKRVIGTVANVSVQQFAPVSLGYSLGAAFPTRSLSFELLDVATGPQDLFAARRDLNTDQRADKIIIRRGLNIANNGSIPVLDFNAVEAFAPTTANFTLANIGADSATVSTIFTGTRGSAIGYVGQVRAAGSAVAYDALPAARLNSGELQSLIAVTTTSASDSRTSGVYFQTPTNQTVTFGPALSTPTLTRLAGGNYSRVQVQLGVQNDYARAFIANFTQSGANRSVTIRTTAAYTNGAAWNVTIPAFSGGGWLDSWGLLNGTPINWDISANGGALFLFDASVAAGTTFRSAQRTSVSPLP